MRKWFYLTSFSIGAALLISAQSLAKAEKEETARPKVLLVYSSGEPYARMWKIEGPEELEGITAPTPMEMNTRIAAERIRDKLQEKGIPVRFARVEEITDWREILRYETIIIGSATRFWNMTWETKRFFEDLFFKIYFKEGKAKDKTFALFTTTEIVPSGEKALAAMEAAISDCGGRISLKMILHKEMSLQEACSEIDRFSTGIAKLIR